MATPRSRSRESSVSRRSLPQRASLSRLSNPDVFSDDFALSSRGNSPVDSIDGSSDNLPAHPSSQPPPPRLSTANPPSHLDTINFSRPSSTCKRPLTSGEGLSVVPRRAISAASHPDAATQRSSSVSSHFSIPRAQSPYTGPTAPTQPYAMYPQVTRASSIASESTIRPVERPYFGTGGPEHPYGMYPQNTVDEEEDDTHGAPSTIPLGFPGMAQSYTGNQASGHDLGDIVGRDGHVEQLPPYTRYADNTIAKAGSEDVPPPVTVDISSPSSTIAPTTESNVDLNPAGPSEVGQPQTDYSEKSKPPRRLRRKICWGISLCVWLLVGGVIVIAATLGGVIGGVIGNDRASDAASENGPTATTTVWLDAGPLPTNVPPPNCTPGAYNMPTSNQSVYTPSCILNQQYAAAWECLDEEPVPFWIEYKGQKPFIKLGQPGPGRTAFTYGAQLPNLNDSYFPLVPSIDKDDPNAGGAMFVALLYNKLTVVHSSAFSGSKRSLDLSNLGKREMEPAPVSKTDKPYFCWFNQTLLELFIYSNISTSASAANSIAYPYASSTTAGVNVFSDSSVTSMMAQSSTYNINQLASPTPTPPPPPPPVAYTDSSDGIWPITTDTWSPSERLARRDDDDNYPIYGKQVRLAEKRAPSGNGDDVTPYCVQMEIRDDWSVCPIPGSYFQIQEKEPSASGVSRRWNRPRSMNNLDSDCACQWYST